MKNRYIFCLLLLTATGLQSMESEVKALPDWRTAENKLANKYKALLEEGLNAYDGKKNIYPDNFIEAGKKFGLPKSKTKEILKAARLRKGDTITHLLVIYKKIDELIKFADQDLLSLEANEQNLTAYDIASTLILNLVEKVQGIADIQEIIGVSCNTACIYLILSNYIKIKENAEYKKEITEGRETIWCCNRHCNLRLC